MTTYSVYIIELDPAVLDLAHWTRSNPDQTKEECFYVGQTALTIYLYRLILLIHRHGLTVYQRTFK